MMKILLRLGFVGGLMALPLAASAYGAVCGCGPDCGCALCGCL